MRTVAAAARACGDGARTDAGGDGVRADADGDGACTDAGGDGARTHAVTRVRWQRWRRVHTGGDGARADADGDARAVMCGRAQAVVRVQTRVVVRVPGRGGRRRRRNWRARRGVEPRHGPVEYHWKFVLRRSKWGGERVIRITLTKGGRGEKGRTSCAAWALSCRATCTTLCSHETCAAMEDLP
jgi:hypothetical protein